MNQGNLILFNKPYGVVSRFTGAPPNLSDYIDLKGFYPAGRLDKDSEGLLLLTSDGPLQARISDPRFKMDKTYLVQVDGEISPDALKKLAAGIELKDGLTRPARASLLTEPPLPPRSPPVRFRKNLPDSWISLTIREGRNRQVRRMTAATGYPTLRLYRRAIGPWSIADIPVGEYRTEQVNLPKN